MSDLSGFGPSRFLAAVADRSSLFLSALRPIRHFPLACLLAVLLFFPGASFAVGRIYADVVVQGATAYNSPAAAQAGIDALIATDMAAHPGAARDGNSVQWEENSDGANERITQSYSVRQGANVTLYRASALLIYRTAVAARPQMETLHDSAGRLVFQNNHNNWGDTIWGYSATSAADAMLRLHEIPMLVAVRNATGPTGYYGQYSVYANPVAANSLPPPWGPTHPDPYNRYVLYTKTVYYPNANPPIPPVVTTAWVLTVGYYVQDTVNTSAYYIDTRTTKEYTETYTLELAPASATVEPGKTLTFTATVKNQDGDPPSVPVPVAIEVEVEPFSGGHDHNDSSRPKGSVSPASGNTSFQVEFTSTEVSGTHFITATCDMCVNKTEIAMVDVMVPGLETIPASTFYTMLESTGDVIGARTGWHTDNHNLTPAAAAMLWQLAVPYQVEQRFKLRDPATGKFTIPPPVMHLNDASLPWGGVYDICARPDACPKRGTILWKEPHKGHRRGTVIDVRANGADGSIPTSNKIKFINSLIERGMPYLHEDKNTSNEHFHLMLLGTQE